MNIIVLAQKPHPMEALLCSMGKEKNLCFTVNNLAMLEKEARLRVLHLLLVEENFLHLKEKTDVLTTCLGLLNENIPIAYFSNENLNISIISKGTNVYNSQASLELLDMLQIKISNLNKNYKNLLRPAEKKLYSFLKENDQTSTSLTQMSEYLWGCTTSAHTKTLYAYIHRIKQILSESDNNIEWLIKEKKGCYRISSDIKEVQKYTVANSK